MDKKTKPKKDGFKKPAGATSYTAASDRKTPLEAKRDDDITRVRP